MNVCSLFTLLCTIFLTSCGTVTIKQIAGDKVPENLTQRLCGVTWRAADGGTGVFQVEDEAKGIYELRAQKTKEKEEKVHFAFRTLGERVVVTVWGDEQKNEKESMLFLRVAVSEDHIALFMPDSDKFTDAVKKKLIPGTVEEEKVQWRSKEEGKPQKTERVVLDKFGAEEAEKMGGVLACFDPDPMGVFVRETAWPRDTVKKSVRTEVRKKQAEEPAPKTVLDELPYGIPVNGKKGMIHSPYAREKGPLDVTGYKRGTRVECPYTRKHFRVP